MRDFAVSRSCGTSRSSSSEFLSLRLSCILLWECTRTKQKCHVAVPASRGAENAVLHAPFIVHIFDFVNLLFLLAAPVSIGIALFFKRDSLRRPEILLAFINLVFFTSLAFFGNTSLGIARDWDINAGLGLALIFFMISLARYADQALVGTYLMYIMAGSALVTGCGWFASNIDEASAVAKFRAIMALDDKHIPADYALTGYEHLRKHYYAQHDSMNVSWAIRKKIECCNYPNDYRDFLNSMQESASLPKNSGSMTGCSAASGPSSIRCSASTATLWRNMNSVSCLSSHAKRSMNHFIRWSSRNAQVLPLLLNSHRSNPFTAWRPSLPICSMSLIG